LLALVLLIVGILMWRKYNTNRGEWFEYKRTLPTHWWYNHLDRIIRVSYDQGLTYVNCRDTACEKIQLFLERVLATTDQDHAVVRCTTHPETGECSMDISHDNPQGHEQGRYAPCESVIPKRLCLQLRDAVAVHIQAK